MQKKKRKEKEKRPNEIKIQQPMLLSSGIMSGSVVPKSPFNENQTMTAQEQCCVSVEELLCLLNRAYRNFPSIGVEI
jgi:hypothetical protein